MKPVLEDIKNHQGLSSFYAYRLQMLEFEFKWHYHPEYELTYIVKGNGYRIVGNSHELYTDGDLVLLGSNVPHTWVGKSLTDECFEVIVVQFSSAFIERFMDFKECYGLRELLKKSSLGLSFTEENKKIKKNLLKLTQATDFDRLYWLFSVFNELLKKESKPLSASTYQLGVNKESEIRINKVCVFLQNHYKEKITLKQVSNLIYLSESNFCKFFKKATGKTYSDYLNDIRINESCRLLLHTDKSINDIAFYVGFETISYFNRVFFKKKGVSPRYFRKYNLNVARM